MTFCPMPLRSHACCDLTLKNFYYRMALHSNPADGTLYREVDANYLQNCFQGHSRLISIAGAASFSSDLSRSMPCGIWLMVGLG